MKAEMINKVIELINEDKMNEAFELAYNNNIELCEDWVEIDGKEYYVVTVEDELLRFEI